MEVDVLTVDVKVFLHCLPMLGIEDLDKTDLLIVCLLLFVVAIDSSVLFFNKLKFIWFCTLWNAGVSSFQGHMFDSWKVKKIHLEL